METLKDSLVPFTCFGPSSDYVETSIRGRPRDMGELHCFGALAAICYRRESGDKGYRHFIVGRSKVGKKLREAKQDRPGGFITVAFFGANMPMTLSWSRERQMSRSMRSGEYRLVCGEAKQGISTVLFHDTGEQRQSLRRRRGWRESRLPILSIRHPNTTVWLSQ